MVTDKNELIIVNPKEKSTDTIVTGITTHFNNIT